MKYKAKVILIILLSLLTQSLCVKAQSINEEKVKAVFIFNFMKHTIWPNENTKPAFTIVVYKDTNFYNSLSPLLLDKQLRNKPINLVESDDLTKIKSAQVVVIPESLNAQIEQIAFELRRSETLLITQNAVYKKDVMINFIHSENKNNLSFEINKSNLVYEQLTISNELLLLGGTELDVATLYRETEVAMQEIKQREIAMQEQLSSAANNLDRSKFQLNKNNELLKKRELALKKQEAELEKLQRSFSEKELELNQLQQSFIEKEFELSAISSQQTSALEKSKQVLKQKNVEVLEKEKQITRLGQAISLNKAEIDQQILKLKKQRAEISNKNQTIKSKNTYLAVTVFFIIIILIFTLLVALLFMRNRKVTSELQHTLENLENTQSQLVQSEKMASLGLLTAGISHEINTPIGIVVTSLSIIQDRATELIQKIADNKLTKSKLNSSLSDIAQSTEVSVKSLDRVTTLITNFKQVAVDHVVEEPREINLGTYISEIVDTLSSQLRKKDIQYNDVNQYAIVITTVPGALAQVLTNLITNTINHAFSAPTKIKEQAKIDIKLLQESSQEVIIEFSDNGCGMSKQVLENIYEPFYTTKRGQGGTGLGMNIVYNIVQQKLKGNIDIKSTENFGTKVTVTLPNFINGSSENKE